VVSNYAQVKEIKDEFESKANEIEKEFDRQIKKIKEESINRDTEIVKSISNAVNEMTNMKNESKMIYESEIKLNETQKFIFEEMTKLVTEISNLKNNR
jgi:vacuolar-type H+-ATPase subunit E/Vma4